MGHSIYPECTKFEEVSKEVETIMDFLRWLFEEKSVSLKENMFSSFIQSDKVEEFLYEFFDIDGKKLGEERERLLKGIQIMEKHKE